jgi:hypothetical protein
MSACHSYEPRRYHILVLCLYCLADIAGAHQGLPRLWRRIDVPRALLAEEGYGGDIRIGDLTANGEVDFVLFRSTDGGLKPCFIGAFDLAGEVVWKHGRGGTQPVRPGPAAVYDLDDDGAAEVLCLFANPTVDADVASMDNVVLQVRDGKTGRILRQSSCPQLRACRGSGPNWVHQRLLVANLGGRCRPRDFIIKLGSRVLAFDARLNLLWTYDIKWNEYGRCSAYIPAVGDLDGDGKDEVNGGFYILDHDGKPLWEGQIAHHMDSVAVVSWDNGTTRAVCSGYGHVLGTRGEVILSLGKELVPHGQEVRVADFDAGAPGPEMIIRNEGHSPRVMVVANNGAILRRFVLNDSPNHTGMEVVFWNGSEAEAVLYNGGMLWHGDGRRLAELPGLPEPTGPAKMGWYHCIPANVCGDRREEVVLYNPWDRSVWIFTPEPFDRAAFRGYRAGRRQYNPRLMD